MPPISRVYVFRFASLSFRRDRGKVEAVEGADDGRATGTSCVFEMSAAGQRPFERQMVVKRVCIKKAVFTKRYNCPRILIF